MLSRETVGGTSNKGGTVGGLNGIGVLVLGCGVGVPPSIGGVTMPKSSTGAVLVMMTGVASMVGAKLGVGVGVAIIKNVLVGVGAFRVFIALMVATSAVAVISTSLMGVSVGVGDGVAVNDSAVRVANTDVNVAATCSYKAVADATSSTVAVGVRV